MARRPGRGRSVGLGAPVPGGAGKQLPHRPVVRFPEHGTDLVRAEAWGVDPAAAAASRWRDRRARTRRSWRWRPWLVQHAMSAMEAEIGKLAVMADGEPCGSHGSDGGP
ncbi:unnamed protein product [Miscanthus lutarioriparius]|uniref:Uncharacterized protein n=1 Tax=Miscanthus lutarioriparius TaxID=422564 RepID=A0A811MV18_9POAL|nr:unnamed protein product [Miscanthus lutarioriparius]